MVGGINGGYNSYASNLNTGSYTNAGSRASAYEANGSAAMDGEQPAERVIIRNPG